MSVVARWGAFLDAIGQIIKTTWIRPLIQMKLIQRGGRITRKRIPPKDVDGRMQALRGQVKMDESPHGPTRYGGQKLKLARRYARRRPIRRRRQRQRKRNVWNNPKCER